MPVRILHVVTSMDAGGIETMLMNIFRNIDRERIVFDFAVHRESEGHYDGEILSLGGKIHVFPRLKPHKAISYINFLNEFLGENSQYTIVHSHINQYSFLPLFAASRKPGVFKIAHGHQYHEGWSSISKHRLPFVLLCKAGINKVTDSRFACSRDAGAWLFGKDKDFHVLSNAIDASRYSFRKELDGDIKAELGLDEKFIIGHIGNFSKAKNYPFILEVFSRLLEKKPDSMLVLVGKNESNPWVEERIKELGIQDSVIVTGVRSDIPDLLKAMDAFLFPSLHEGLPVTLVEAQASGIKCLVSDAVTEEVKITDNLEFMSLEKPADAWADKLLEHADGYERQDTYQQIVDAGYDIQSNVRWLENFYLEAAERARQSA